MNSTTWWVLASSIPVALIIMAVAFLTMRAKIKRVRRESMGSSTKSHLNPALNRDDHGLLMWELREKTKAPLADLSMEFAINTALRNKYKKLFIKGFNEKYEEKSLITKTELKLSKDKFDFALINFHDGLVDEIDNIMKKSEDKSLIMIVNASKKKSVKNMLSYLKLTGIRNEYHKIDLGIVLIAK